jgi:Fe2+ or Zn2+ uptake regulation protein
MIDFKELLKEHGIPPSLQRIKILEYLHDFNTHPTADVIYQALMNEMPTLSKTTVYNTLKAFAEKGVIVELSLFENEVRYEYNTTPHIHFKCIKCNIIYDISESFECLKNKEIEGHKVLEHHIYLKGICKNCRDSEE